MGRGNRWGGDIFPKVFCHAFGIFGGEINHGTITSLVESECPLP